MNTNDIKRLFPLASPSLLAANSGTPPILERPAGNAALGEDESQEGHSGRVHLRIVSVRKRLLDPDNLSPKWTIDCLRYVGAISGDEPDKITLEVSQRKAEKGEEEFTEVSAYAL